MGMDEGGRNFSDEADDVGDEEFEGNADVADMQMNFDKASDGDEVDEDYDFGGAGPTKNDD